MTDQQFFDTVALHLLRQGKQSVRADKGGCMYRGPDGLKCAIGVLIPDSEYNKGLEHTDADESPVIDVLEQTYGQIELPTAALLRALQSTHDSGTPDKWESQLQTVAKIHDLQWTWQVQPQIRVKVASVFNSASMAIWWGHTKEPVSKHGLAYSEWGAVGLANFYSDHEKEDIRRAQQVILDRQRPCGDMWGWLTDNKVPIEDCSQVNLQLHKRKWLESLATEFIS